MFGNYAKMNDPRAVIDFYSRWTRVYDYVARYTPGVTRIRKRTVDALNLEPGQTVVEMGCGTGANIGLLSDRVGPTGRVVGIDITPRVLQRARSHHPRSADTAIEFVRGDALHPPLRSADVILATFVMGMLHDPARAIEHWCDLLSSGGRIVLLDAVPSHTRIGRVLNPGFRAFVTTTSPARTRRRHPDPARSLETRVNEARSALADQCTIEIDSSAAFGFLRLTAGKRA